MWVFFNWILIHYCFILLLWSLLFESARCGDMFKQAEFAGLSCSLFTRLHYYYYFFFAYIFMHTLKYGILNLTLSDNIFR